MKGTNDHDKCASIDRQSAAHRPLLQSLLATKTTLNCRIPHVSPRFTREPTASTWSLRANAGHATLKSPCRGYSEAVALGENAYLVARQAVLCARHCIPHLYQALLELQATPLTSNEVRRESHTYCSANLLHGAANRQTPCTSAW